MPLLQPQDAVGERFDLGLLPQQQTPQSTLVQLKRRKLELLQSMKDRLTSGIVPRAENGAETTPEQAALRSGVGRYVGNALGIPDLLVNMASPPRAEDGLPPTMTGWMQSLSTPRVPMPSAADVMTGIDAAGETAAALTSGDFSQFSPDMGEASRMRSEVMAQQQPTPSAVGEVLGDVATLATLRAPLSKARGLQVATAAERQALLRAEILKAKESGLITSPLMADSVPAMFQRMTTNSQGFGSLMEKTGRIAEAGLEGATLAILTDNDPVETAAWSAGTQAAGNVALWATTSPNLLKIGTAALAGTVLFQMVNSMAPGGQDRILPAIESGFNKVALGMTAGLMMGAAGMGRVPSKAGPMTVVTDYLTAIPRAATISVINDMQKDPAAQSIVRRLSVDPNYFGPTAGRRLERAFRNPNISISGVIEDLMEQKPFREKFEALENAN